MSHYMVMDACAEYCSNKVTLLVTAEIFSTVTCTFNYQK